MSFKSFCYLFVILNIDRREHLRPMSPKQPISRDRPTSHDPYTI